MVIRAEVSLTFEVRGGNLSIFKEIREHLLMKCLKMGLFCLKFPKFCNIHDKFGLFSKFEIRQGKIYKSSKPRQGIYMLLELTSALMLICVPGRVSGMNFRTWLDMKCIFRLHRAMKRGQTRNNVSLRSAGGMISYDNNAYQESQYVQRGQSWYQQKSLRFEDKIKWDTTISHGCIFSIIL